jgi:hypothetical protein
VGEYANWITPGDVGNVSEIKPGAGAVLRSRPVEARGLS